MPPLFEKVTDLVAGAEVLRRRSYGVIEAAEGQLRCVRLRPYPKVVSFAEALVLGGLWHGRSEGDRCLLYYNRPWRFPQFLVVKYVVSGKGTTYRTLRAAVRALDEIARLKRSDALLADVANWRITASMLARWGWAPHCPSAWHRHFIKRFYGEYAEPRAGAAQP